MKKLYTTLTGLALLAGGLSGRLLAQGADGYGAGIKIPLDSSGQKYIRFLNWHQFWIHHNQNNPGTLVNGEPTNSQVDYSIRRSRFLFYSQISPKFMVLTHIGINNQTLVGGGALGQGANVGGTTPDGKKPQIFVHEATAEYRVYKDYLSVGGGLHYWNGVTRLASASTISTMMLDAPIFNWPNIDANDQFARMMGIYFKGKIGKFDYRMAINQPFAVPSTNSLTRLDTTAAKNNVVNAAYRGIGASKNAYQGYFMYQFWDKESNLLPYMVGTYIGTKKVFNIGAGFYYNKDAMWAAKGNGVKWDTVRQDQAMYAVDVYMDRPLNKEKGTALTFYACYNRLMMGDNFVRNIGLANPGNGNGAGITFSGTGNSFPTIGTGSIIHAQAGYLFPKVKYLGKFQLIGDVTYAKFDRIDKAIAIPDVGLNWFVNGHSAKITFNYRARPVVDYADSAKKYGALKQTDSKSEFIIQLQVFL